MISPRLLDSLRAGSKQAVFSDDSALLAQLRQAFPSAVLLAGSMAPATRAAALAAFASDPDCQLILVHLNTATATGYSLDRATHAHFILRRPQLPEVLLQAQARVQRPTIATPAPLTFWRHQSI